jgi:NADPH:quinone reductase-like Zn-dependent oxidoreductase
MRADGDQLGQIVPLIDAPVIRPLIDRIFQFESM